LADNNEYHRVDDNVNFVLNDFDVLDYGKHNVEFCVYDFEFDEHNKYDSAVRSR
jgi:hypothetical protein